jgi:hypothetical protein
MCLGVRDLGRDDGINVVDGLDLACFVKDEKDVGVRQATLLKLDHICISDDLAI